jgi:hypothetical protein
MWHGLQNRFQRVGQRLKSTMAGRRGNIYQLSHDGIGINFSWTTLENEMGERKIAWSSIKSLHAFKRDLITVDHICMAILLKDGDVLQFDEDMIGWQELVMNLPVYLSGCKPFQEWWPIVAFPPFATNMTLLYPTSAPD